MIYFKIGSTDFSDYVQSMKVDFEVLLSSDSGRNAAGNNVVDIVNRKDKVSVTFKPLEAAAMQTLLNAVQPYTVTVSYYNPRTQSLKTISTYISTPSVEFYRIIDGKVLYKALGINFIEM